ADPRACPRATAKPSKITAATPHPPRGDLEAGLVTRRRPGPLFAGAFFARASEQAARGSGSLAVHTDINLEMSEGSRRSGVIEQSTVKIYNLKVRRRTEGLGRDFLLA